MTWIPEVTVEQLASRLRGPVDQHPLLLDVRRQDEHEYVALPDSRLIPLDELDEHRHREVVVYCHHGIRSMQGAAVLLAAGFSAQSLAGGIDAWACVIDETMRRY